MLDALEEGLFPDRVLEREVLRQRFGGGFNIRQEWKQSLRFGSKIERIVDDGIIERFDAKSIACRDQPAASLIP